jgi:hypothetical protein
VNLPAANYLRNFCENQWPGKEVDPLSASARFMQLKHVRPIQNTDPPCAQLRDASVKGGVSSLGTIEKRHCNQGKPFANSLSQQPEHKSVTNSQRPLVDRVAGGGRDDNRGRGWQNIRLPWSLVVATHWVAGLALKLRHVKEIERIRCCDDTDIPAIGVRKVDQDADLVGWRSSADSDIEDATGS